MSHQALLLLSLNHVTTLKPSPPPHLIPCFKRPLRGEDLDVGGRDFLPTGEVDVKVTEAE